MRYTKKKKILLVYRFKLTFLVELSVYVVLS